MDSLMQLEIQFTLFLQHLGSWLALPFNAITFLGNEFFFLLVMPAIFWCIDATLGFRLGLMLVATNSINGYLKVLFHSPRPFWVDGNVKAYSSETGFGLPSGHSQNAASMWGLLAASLKKKWLTIICIIAIFLIGLSRIYLGMHFTRDVLSGWLIGILLVFIFIWLEKPFTRWISKKSPLFKVILAFAVSLLIICLGYLSVAADANWTFPVAWTQQAEAAGAETPAPFDQTGTIEIAGVLFGFVSGYVWLLKKKGEYVIKGPVSKRIYRYLIGLAGLAIIYLGLKLVFPTSPDWLGLTLKYVRYALVGFWVSALAPLVFGKLKLDE